MPESASQRNQPETDDDENGSLNIGVIAETTHELSRLSGLMTRIGFKLSYSSTLDAHADIAASISASLEKVDVWLLRTETDVDAWTSIIECLIQYDTAFVIDDVSVGNQGHEEYYRLKINKASVLQISRNNAEALAEQIWVLAASAGGPEAVIRFFEAIETHASSDQTNAFIYAQHIDQYGLDNLVGALARKTSYRVSSCLNNDVIRAGHVYVVSPNHEVHINHEKNFTVTGQAWNGIYSPSIEQVIAKVGRVYKHKSTVIVFSGMGNDGANAIRLMKAEGSQVWVQSPDSCSIDSMPKEALATGCVDFSGSPQQLADHFLKQQAEQLVEQ